MAFKMKGFSPFSKNEDSSKFMEQNKLEMAKQDMIEEYVKTGVMPSKIDTSMYKSLGDSEEGRKLLKQYLKDREVTESTEEVDLTKKTGLGPR